jgi:phage baseplate assembly protein V
VDNRELKKLNDKIRNSAGARLTMDSVEDGSKMQGMKAVGLDGEVMENCERFQNYGFTSNPPAGEAIGIPIGGDRGHMCIVAVDDRGSRKTGLKTGEVSMYHANGDHISLQDANKTELATKELKIGAEVKTDITSPEIKLVGDVTIEGNLTVTGTITVTGDVTAGAISVINHTHPGDSGGTTGAPK